MPNFWKRKSSKSDGSKKPRRKKSELQTWIAKLDKVMSLYIRMRDSKEFHYKYFRCISCGRVLPVSQEDCGHYVGRSNLSVRFDTRNMNGECRYCNRMDSSHLIGYRRNLIMKLGKQMFKNKYPHVNMGTPGALTEMKRLGEQQVDLLEVQGHQAKHWSVFELQELYKYYSALILKMKEDI
jgi:hypothetical protein